MTTVSKQHDTGNGTRRGRGGWNAFGGFERIWEILLIATVLPTVFYGVQSLNNLPIA